LAGNAFSDKRPLLASRTKAAGQAALVIAASPVRREGYRNNQIGDRTTRFTSSVPMPVAKSHPGAAAYAGWSFFELTESTPFVPDGRKQFTFPLQLISMSPRVTSWKVQNFLVPFVELQDALPRLPYSILANA
jgi:hypothetical protein